MGTARHAVAELVGRHPRQSRKRRKLMKRLHVQPVLLRSLHFFPPPLVFSQSLSASRSVEAKQECRAVMALAFWVEKV